jgi:hypothetical protein
MRTLGNSSTDGGIGGYDLARPEDRALAFDYNGTGKLDHLVFYRPGKGACFVIKRQAPGNNFQALPGLKEGDPGGGIGGYDLARPEDRVFAFDYDGFGKLDHLVLYRPGAEVPWFVKKGPQGGVVRVNV